MVLNATLNKFFQLNRGGQLYFVEETVVPGENPPQVTDKFYHIMLYRVHLAWAGFELTKLAVIGNNYTYSCKSNYHMTTITTALVGIISNIYI